MLYQLVIVLTYAFLGLGIAYIDSAYDKRLFNKRMANFLALLCGILMALLIIFDQPSATIFLAMILAVVITKKVDNSAFYAGTFVIILLLVLFNNVQRIELFPFSALFFSGVVDELGSDWVDKKEKSKNKKITYRLLEEFLVNRFMMKVVLFGLFLFNFFTWVYVVAFVAFDTAYMAVDYYGIHQK